MKNDKELLGRALLVIAGLLGVEPGARFTWKDDGREFEVVGLRYMSADTVGGDVLNYLVGEQHVVVREDGESDMWLGTCSLECVNRFVEGCPKRKWPSIGIGELEDFLDGLYPDGVVAILKEVA